MENHSERVRKRQRSSTSLGWGLFVSGLLLGWICCPHSQEWCSRLLALSNPPPLFALFFSLLFCFFQLLLQRFLRKAHSLGRWSFHLMLPPRRLIYTEAHTYPRIDGLLSAWKSWRVGRGSFLLANTAAWCSKPCSYDHLFLPPADSLIAPACQKFCVFCSLPNKIYFKAYRWTACALCIVQFGPEHIDVCSCINMWAETALISLINSTVWHPVFVGNSLSSLDVREKVLTFYYLYSTFSSCLKLFMWSGIFERSPFLLQKLVNPVFELHQYAGNGKFRLAESHFPSLNCLFPLFTAGASPSALINSNCE